MKLHCAILNDQALFDPATLSIREGTAPGISILMGCRKGSKTEEGIAYRFDASQFSAETARAWLEQRTISSQRFQAADASTDDGVAFSVAVLKEGDFPGSVDGEPAQIPLTREQIEQCRRDTNDLLNDGSLDVVARIDPSQAIGGAQLGHSPDQSAVQNLFPDGGAAALGHMRQLRWIGDTLAADFQGVSQKFADCVKRGLWHARSADLIHNWTHPVTKRVYPMIMKSLSWLGSEMPAVPVHEIWGLAATGGGSAALSTAGGKPPSGGQAICIRFESSDGSHVPGSPAGGAPANPPNDQAPPGSGGTTQNDDAAQKAAEEKSRMDELEKLKAQVAQLAQKLEAVEARATQAEEKVELAKRQLVTETLDRCRDERRITPAQHEQYSKVALAMSFENAKAYVETMKDRPQAPDPTKPVARQTGAGADINALTGEQKILAFAANFQLEGKGTYAEGVKVASRIFPADAEGYLAAHGYHGKGEV